MGTWLIYVAAAFGGGAVASVLRLPPLVGFLAAGFALGYAGVPETPELAVVAELSEVLPQLPAPLAERVQAWRDNAKVRALRPSARERLCRLVQRTGQWLKEAAISLEAALRFVQWLEPLMRRESYLALLLERPTVHERLLHMLGAAAWPARYLQQHPGVIDELASDQLLHERFDAQAFEHDLQLRLQALQREHLQMRLRGLVRGHPHAQSPRGLPQLRRQCRGHQRFVPLSADDRGGAGDRHRLPVLFRVVAG